MYTQCSNCLSEIFFPDGKDQVRCPACTRINDRPKTKGETMSRMKRANELCADGEFDAAAALYHRVLEENLDEHEARWGLLLCKYGVIYERDNGGRRYPTCRVDRTSAFCSEPEFRRACELASPEVRAQYEADGRYIDAIQSGIRRLEDEEPPYDVFICYKETAPDGGRTVDSVLAQDLYAELTRLDYRVFYAPESLTGLLGADYEAAIYYAVSTAQVMLVVGTCPEYFGSTWVRSEWRRFLAQIDSGARKRLVALYRGMPAEKLPREFLNRRLQSVNMDRLGALLDVDSFLQRFIQKEKPAPAVPEPKQEAPAEQPPESPMDALKRRAESGDADAAMELGRRHETGDGVEQSTARAGYWYAQALVKGRTEAMEAIARLSGARPAVPEKEPPVPEKKSVVQEKESPVPEKKTVVQEKEPPVPEKKPVAQEKESPVPEKKPVAQEKKPPVPEKKPAVREKEIPAQEKKTVFAEEPSVPKGEAQEMFRRVQVLWNTGTEEEVRSVVSGLSRRAESGDREAMFWLAKCCQYGMGTPKDVSREAELYRQSAEKGFADAQIELGSCLRLGRGVEKDEAAADVMYKRAFRQYSAAGDTDWGRKGMARCRANGWGVEKDAAQAFKLYLAAAENSDAEAQYEIFQCLQYGIGVRKDEKLAMSWLKRAAEQGWPEAESDMALQTMLRADGIPDWDEIYRWRRRAFDHGCHAETIQLALLYEKGHGVEKNPDEAFRLYSQAERHGEPGAVFFMGECWRNGVGTRKDTAMAVQYYRRGAETGDQESMLALAHMAESGEGMKKDPAEAFRLYVQVAEMDGVDAKKAALEAGRCCEGGIGTQKDEPAALEWYKKAGFWGEPAKASLEKRLAQKQTPPEPKKPEPKKPEPENAPSGTWKPDPKINEEFNEIVKEVLGNAAEDKPKKPEPAPVKKQSVFDPDPEMEKVRKAIASSDLEKRIAMAEEYLTGDREKMNTDCAERLLESLPAWHREVPEAKYLTGLLYWYGTSTKRPNPEMAAWYIEKAAHGKDTRAQLMMGQMCMTGTGVARDRDAAIRWYESAAYAGSAEAHYQLGFLGYVPTGVMSSDSYAVSHFKQAAQQHHAGAEAMLAFMLEKCQLKDPTLDMRALYTDAAKQGNDSAQHWMGEQCEQQGRIADAMQWYKKAAAQGFVLSMARLGRLEEEQHCDSNAVEWYTMAAERGDRDSMYALAMLKYNGRGTQKDRAGALEYLKKAKEKGHKEAAQFLARHMKFGRLW